MSALTPEIKNLLTLRGIHKRFPGVHALKGVCLDVCGGEVHAIVGENGAGKSTLMQILAGVHQPDAGRIDFDRRQDVHFLDERSAQDHGIALVYQERSLFGSMNVAENIFAARQPTNRWGQIDRSALASRTRALLEEVGLEIHEETQVDSLSSAQQQLVEVAKALSLEPKLVLFDEPTAALTPTESDRLFDLIRRLKNRNVGVIYISHRLDEVFSISDRVTVLKDGSGQGTFPTKELTSSELVGLMVGREMNPHIPRSIPPAPDARVVLDVRGIRDLDTRTGLGPRLHDIHFSVRAGEIVGLAGLVGAGRTELALALFGARDGVAGEVYVQGKRLVLNSPADAIAAGIGYLSEDRKDGGLFLEMSIEDNISAVAPPQVSSWAFNRRKQQATADRMCASLQIVCRGPSDLVQNLSGGNQQKVALAKWLVINPRILIVDEPTKGVDVGAKAEIHNILFDLARNGTAILVISSDLPEILAVSDRLLVMREGRITGELTRAQATEQSVMQYASLGSRSQS